MKKEGSKLTIVLVSIIILLLLILGYGLYSGFRVKAELQNLNSQINTLVSEKNVITSQFDNLKKDYDLLQQDIARIYKTCITENVCKGRFPNVSWNCNNVGDETNTNPSHICFCTSSCQLNATEMKK